MAQDIKLYALAPNANFDKSKNDVDITDGQTHIEVTPVGISSTLQKPEKVAQSTVSLHNQLRTTNSEDREHQIVTSTLSADDNSSEAELDFPEGGMQANLVVFGSFCGLLIGFGLLNTIGVIQAYVRQNILEDATETQVGWVFSVFLFFAFGGGIYAGPIFDFTGARFPMYVGSVLIFAGLIATASCTTVWQFVLAFGCVVGIGNSFVMNCCISVVSHYFLKRRATALGVCSTAGSIGGVVWPLMLRSLYPKIGYVWTMRIIAFMSAALLAVACIFVKHRITKKLDEGHKKIDILKESLMIRPLLTDPVTFCLSVAIILPEFCLVIGATYLSSYTLAQGYSESNAFLVAIASNCVGIAGRYIPNRIADRYGNINVMVVCIAACSILVLGLWLPYGHSLGHMFAFACLFRFFSASTYSLTPVCTGQISKTEDFGKRYGTVYFLVGIGNLVSLPVGGALIGSSKSGWDHMVIFVGSVEAVSLCFWVATRYLLVGTKIVRV